MSFAQALSRRQFEDWMQAQNFQVVSEDTDGEYWMHLPSGKTIHVSRPDDDFYSHTFIAGLETEIREWGFD